MFISAFLTNNGQPNTDTMKPVYKATVGINLLASVKAQASPTLLPDLTAVLAVV